MIKMKCVYISLLASVLLFQAALSVQTSCPCKCSNGLNGMNGKDGRDGRDGKDGAKLLLDFQGERGPPGLLSTFPGGAIKIGDTSAACTSGTAGTIRYSPSQKALLLCNGNMWVPMIPAGKGQMKALPGRHCLDILNSGFSHGDDYYWIDPNGGSTDDSFQAFCDMTTERGGWTLVATKVTPSFLFIKSGFSSQASREADIDSASRIHPSMGDWTEAMFRFGDSTTIRVIYKRQCSGGTGTDFEKFLMGGQFQLIKNVKGFYKYSPATGNTREPPSGCYTINNLHYHSNSMISEAHSGTDKWLDMWKTADNANNYHFTDNAAAMGTKCIAGYCYLNKPIWFMVR